MKRGREHEQNREVGDSSARREGFNGQRRGASIEVSVVAVCGCVSESRGGHLVYCETCPVCMREAKKWHDDLDGQGWLDV